MSESVVVNGTTYNGVDALALTRPDGSVVIFYPDAIRYNAQTLSEEQKAQARLNIGATSEAHSPLHGKRLACCGDSIMESRTDEASPAYNGGGWAAIVGGRNAMTVENIAKGGSTLSNYYNSNGVYSNSHTINRQIELIGDADYIIFNGWENDFGKNKPIGVITDGYDSTFDKDTILGGLEHICFTLNTAFVGKKYGYLFNHKTYLDTQEASNIGTALHLKTQMKKVLEKWGVPYLDLEQLIPPLLHIPALRSAYTGNNGDGVHPNKEGYELFYCDKIEAWMKSFFGNAGEPLPEPEAPYTNLVPASINADGTQYGWDRDGDGEIDPDHVGFKLGARLSSSGIEKSAGVYSLITGFMPVTGGAVVRAKGPKISVGSGSSYVCVYDSNFAFLGGMTLSGTDYDATHDVIGNIELDTVNDMAIITLNNVDSIAYIRINNAGDGSTSQDGNTLIVTANEEII
jgi:lysophospholipase L1-like esterase